MILWKSPFNKIVRSHEAAVIGILAGILLGIGLMLLTSITIEKDVYKSPIALCKTVDNIKTVHFKFSGTISKVECNDGRVFDNF